MDESLRAPGSGFVHPYIWRHRGPTPEIVIAGPERTVRRGGGR